MILRPGLDLGADALGAFAGRHSIRRLAAFGSVLRDDFGDDSDIDLLVEFEPGQVPGLLAMQRWRSSWEKCWAERSISAPSAT